MKVSENSDGLQHRDASAMRAYLLAFLAAAGAPAEDVSGPARELFGPAGAALGEAFETA